MIGRVIVMRRYENRHTLGLGSIEQIADVRDRSQFGYALADNSPRDAIRAQEVDLRIRDHESGISLRYRQVGLRQSRFSRVRILFERAVASQSNGRNHRRRENGPTVLMRGLLFIFISFLP